jgi:hypothetical protein
MLHEGNEITPGILPYALRAALTRVQNRSRRFCQGEFGTKSPGSFEIGSQIFLVSFRHKLHPIKLSRILLKHFLLMEFLICLCRLRAICRLTPSFRFS